MSGKSLKELIVLSLRSKTHNPFRSSLLGIGLFASYIWKKFISSEALPRPAWDEPKVSR